MSLDIEARRRSAEALADQNFLEERAAAFLSELHEDRRSRIGLIPDPRGNARITYVRCVGCNRVFPRGLMNTLEVSHPRGGGYEGRTRAKKRLLCSSCIVSSV